MTLLGIFCRANHPKGYGTCGTPQWAPSVQPTQQHDPSGTAHGYVTLAVQCEDWLELRAIKDRLAVYRTANSGTQKNITSGYRRWNWNGRSDDWFAGPFELVFVTQGYGNSGFGMNGDVFPIGSYISYGDNRAFAFLTAKEVLEKS